MEVKQVEEAEEAKDAEQAKETEARTCAPVLGGKPYIFSSSRRRLVWARLTGTSDCFLSSIFSM